LDLKASAPRAVLALHASSGIDMSPLRTIIDDPSVLAAIHDDRGIAKELTNALLFLGTIDAWKQKHNAGEPPEVLRTLEATMRQCAVRSGEVQPALLDACRLAAKPGKDPLGSVVFWSYIPLERKSMDDTRLAVKNDAKATSFEGDGHLMVERGAGATWAADLLTRANAVAPHSVKEIPTYDDILPALQLRLTPPPPTQLAQAPMASTAPTTAEPIMLCPSFKVFVVPRKSSPGVAMPFPPTNAANNTNNIQRNWLLIRSVEPNPISLDALFDTLRLQFEAVLVAEVGGWAGALVVKKPEDPHG
jgi:hypothetical protein